MRWKTTDPGGTMTQDWGTALAVVSENPIQPMIRDLVFLSPLHPTLGATERRNLGTDVLAPISFLPWWDDAAQCQAFDLIRGMIEILVPFSRKRSGVRRIKLGIKRFPRWATIRRHEHAHDRTGAHHSDKRLIGISPTESLETRRRRKSAASRE